MSETEYCDICDQVTDEDKLAPVLCGEIMNACPLCRYEHEVDCRICSRIEREAEDN